MGSSVEVKEFDGGRSVEMTKVPGLVILEAGDGTYAIDESHFLRQVERLLGISVILHMGGTEGDFALS